MLFILSVLATYLEKLPLRHPSTALLSPKNRAAANPLLLTITSSSSFRPVPKGMDFESTNRLTPLFQEVFFLMPRSLLLAFACKREFLSYQGAKSLLSDQPAETQPTAGQICSLTARCTAKINLHLAVGCLSLPGSLFQA